MTSVRSPISVSFQDDEVEELFDTAHLLIFDRTMLLFDRTLCKAVTAYA